MADDEAHSKKEEGGEDGEGDGGEDAGESAESAVLVFARRRGGLARHHVRGDQVGVRLDARA